MRRLLWIGACGLGLLTPAAAWAAGGPMPPVVGGAGASAPGGKVTYLAMARGGGTVVERVRVASGSVERSRFLRQRLGVPGATADGETTGLSADGRTLVLAATWRTYPPRRARLTVLDARSLRVRARLALAGSFAVDAISPDGRWLYLLHYRARNNPLNYEVRAYDMRARRLEAKPIVDPREPDEKMVGSPTTRTTSPDGRWVYTLYVRPEGAPFIHALDTEGRRAFCIDLPPLHGDLSELRLQLSGASVQVMTQSGPQAVVDTRALAVHRTRPAHRTAAVARPEDGGTPWWPFALGAAAVALGAAVLARRAWTPRPSPDV